MGEKRGDGMGRKTVGEKRGGDMCECVYIPPTYCLIIFHTHCI